MDHFNVFSNLHLHEQEFSENPMERVDMEETITVEEDGIKVILAMLLLEPISILQDLEAVYSYCREKCAVDLQVASKNNLCQCILDLE